MRAGVFQVTPWLPILPALFAQTKLCHATLCQVERCMTQLYGSNNPQFPESCHIFWLTDFDMLNAVTTITLPIRLLNCCIPIERLPHCGIPATMDRDLQSQFFAS